MRPPSLNGDIEEFQEVINFFKVSEGEQQPDETIENEVLTSLNESIILAHKVVSSLRTGCMVHNLHLVIKDGFKNLEVVLFR